MVASVAIGYLLGSSTTTLNSNIDNTKTMIDKDEDTNNIDELLWNGIALYHDAAKSLTPITDKVNTHTYQIMYGKFLWQQ